MKAIIWATGHQKIVNVQLSKISKIYGLHEVVHAIDLEVETHEFAVLVGPSCYEKSMPHRMISGPEEISRGKLHNGHGNQRAFCMTGYGEDYDGLSISSHLNPTFPRAKRHRIATFLAPYRKTIQNAFSRSSMIKDMTVFLTTPTLKKNHSHSQYKTNKSMSALIALK